MGAALLPDLGTLFDGNSTTRGCYCMWFLLSSYAVLIGAELNAEMERQTRRDTTSGGEKPLGQRGAYAADTVGVAKPE